MNFKKKSSLYDSVTYQGLLFLGYESKNIFTKRPYKADAKWRIQQE